MTFATLIFTPIAVLKLAAGVAGSATIVMWTWHRGVLGMFERRYGERS